MCGIATIAIGKRSRGRVPYDLLRKTVRALMVELQPRGIDAAGIAVINEKGPESRVFKKPLRPDRFVVRPMFEETLSLIGPQTNFIMLHARAATVGETRENYNNHPIIADDIVGIHNGTLYNDSQLFADFITDFDQEGDVDSEVIFRLYHYFIRRGESPVEAMAHTGSLLQGAFTGALVDMRQPHRMVMFKNERSLSIFRLPHTDVIITISEAIFYDRVAHRLGITAREICDGVEDGTGIVFDLNQQERITDRIKDFEIPIDKSFSVYQNRGWMYHGC